MNLVWGFFLYTITGFVLLSLPIFHKVEIPLIDSLFISTSAISTTGLVTVSLADSFNLFGQLIVMLLFQIGGIGYMTLTTYFLLFTTKKITYWHKKIIGAEFTMPNTIKINDFLKSVILFTLIMESIGAISFLMTYSEKATYEDVLFEVASSLGTVGLSRGITEDLSDIGKFLIIILMFIGRVGVLTFGFALLAMKHKENEKHIKDDLAV